MTSLKPSHKYNISGTLCCQLKRKPCFAPVGSCRHKGTLKKVLWVTVRLAQMHKRKCAFFLFSDQDRGEKSTHSYGLLIPPF